ncbi:MAG: EAL domain-containing protein [gamma proteobacterium symbiont of Taylorina sp.]|nr:EAL domain-containing protein [gamma proteobacterium symbiont of Taylorina sp.]
MIIISSVMLFLYFMLSWGIYSQAKKNFEEQLYVQQLEHINVLHDLINYSSQVMEQLIESLAQLKLDNNKTGDRKLSDLIGESWSDLQIAWDLKSLGFFHSEAKKSFYWGEQEADLNKLYQIVLQTERPQHQFVCQIHCVLYIAVPVLIQGELKGVISIGKSIAETLISFEKITQADIGILLNMKIPAITNEKNNRPLLQELLLHNVLISRVSGDVSTQTIQKLFNKQHYYISFSPVNLDSKASFIIINNIEHSYQYLQSELKNIIFIGLFSLFITLILLFFLLENALIRIKYFSTALPFLSMTTPDRYQQARAILAKVSRSKYGFDELDQLNTTSIQLSEQLEQLENDSKEKTLQISWIASHDSLTGLYNRHYFHGEFKKIITIAKRYQNKVALFYLDLDQFKIINDTQGHKMGDQLLIQVANVLKSQLNRESDLLCRLGGDEFAIVTPITEIQGTVSLAGKINQLIYNLEFNNIAHQVGFSIGVSIYPEHGNSIYELLSNADLAMYKAKESGFNQYHIYDPNNNYHQELNKKLEWKQLIEKTIAEKQLTLYYQPILNLHTQVISHYECLLRIIKENGEVMGPVDFIQYAEELGLIETIDILVIKLAIEQHIELQKKNKSHLKLAINLSGRSINNDKVKAEIKSSLKNPEVCSEKIIFEITETSAVTNFSSAQIFISEIRALGCQVALDDFGTGFSSFYYLKNMSFDYIKIDGAFIKRIETDKEDKIFVKALSDVARALGKKTIAEFVETENIIDILKELKIDYAQGYHISKPLPAID